jgi:hypothetical protein
MIEMNLKAIHSLYPDHPQVKLLDKDTLKGLPLWAKQSIDVHVVRLNAQFRIYLLTPKGNLSFDQLALIHKKVSSEIDSTLLLRADHLPAKFRPLLVRSRIPFVYKDEAIFAPELGLKFNQLKILDVPSRIETRSTEELLSPISLKITAGILTGFIDKEFTLKALYEKFIDQKIKISLGKLSSSLNDLARKEILLTHGAGPRKYYTSNTRELVWAKVQEMETAPFFRSLETNHVPKEKHLYVFSGETALAHYSNLAAPNMEVIAMTAPNFNAAYQKEALLNVLDDLKNQSIVQIWKEDPVLFSSNNIINPIELYFSLAAHPDERIQMSLTEMLSQQGLERRKE